MREAPWSAVRQLTDCRLAIPCAKALANATALQGAFGTNIFVAAKGLCSSFLRETAGTLPRRSTDPATDGLTGGIT
jgi:hypothetical protein